MLLKLIPLPDLGQGAGIAPASGKESLIDFRKRKQEAPPGVAGTLVLSDEARCRFLQLKGAEGTGSFRELMRCFKASWK